MSELMNDPRTRDYCQNIEVAADRGMVTLSGTVPSEQVHQAAEEIARNTQGVISVIDEMKVVK
jgi:osmotically-inducible protein OsmY